MSGNHDEHPLDITRKALVALRWDLIDYGTEGFERELEALDLVIEYIDDRGDL